MTTALVPAAPKRKGAVSTTETTPRTEPQSPPRDAPILSGDGCVRNVLSGRAVLKFSASPGQKDSKKYFKNYVARTGKTWAEFAEITRTHSVSSYRYGNGTTQSGQFCEGHRAGDSVEGAGNVLLMDFDNKGATFELLRERLEGLSAYMGPSKSWSPTVDKFHVAIELDCELPLDKDEYKRLYKAVTQYLKLEGLYDPAMESWVQQLAPHWHPEGSGYPELIIEGQPLCVAEVLAAYEPPAEEKPKATPLDNIIQRQQVRNPEGKASVIDAFNATFPVEQVLLANGYDSNGQAFRHPESQSGSYSAGVKDGRVNALSPRDPLFTGGEGAHSAFSAFVVLRFGGDKKAAAEYAGKHMLEVTDPETGEVMSWHEWTLREFQLKQGKPTQDSIAQRVERALVGQFKFAHQFGFWMEWGGNRWLKDPRARINNEVRRLVRQANTQGTKELGSANYLRGVLYFVQHSPAFSALGSEFDADNYLLNTPAGVYDLRTGTVSAHHPDQMLTRITAIAPSPDGGELFLLKLLEICSDDNELVEFMQLSLGAMLSGAVEEHWMLFWLGKGRNGKSLLAELILEVLGDYGHTLPSRALLARNTDEHPTSIAALAGRRVVVSSELDDGAFWAAARLKTLTGDAYITARFMKQDEFTFRRTHKHLILANHAPQTRELDPALRVRLKVVPFEASFLGREDPELPAKLRKGAGFVLHWLIEGHRKWVANGKRLPRCAAVERASSAYFENQSTTSMWLEEAGYTVLPDDGRPLREWTRASDGYSRYAQWKRDRGEMPISLTRWSDEMVQLGFKRVRVNGSRFVGFDSSAWRQDFNANDPV